MPARKSPPPPKKASGANIEEWQRRGRKVQFRLGEAESRTLETRAQAEGLSPNEYAQLVLRRDLLIV